MKSHYYLFFMILLASPISYGAVQMPAYYTNSAFSDDVSGSSISLVNPPNNSITSLKNINFIWSSAAGAHSYKLQISKVPDFATIFFADSTLTDTFTTVSVFVPDASYFWKVSGKNDSVYFVSSAVYNFGLENLGISLISPAMGENFVSVPVRFEWTSTNSAISAPGTNAPYQYNNDPLKMFHNVHSSSQYLLEVALDKQFNNVVYLNSGITDTFHTVTSLDINTFYYWKVTPQNDSFFFAPTEAYIFNSFQNEVLLNSPGDSETVSLPVEFSWFQVSNAVTYKLEVALDMNFKAIEYSDSLLTDTSQAVDGLKMAVTYYWKVSAKNDSDYFATSEVRTVFTSTVTPVVLSSPPNNASSVTLPILFSWLRQDAAVSYKLEVATDPSFGIGTIAFRDTSITDTFKVVGFLNLGTIFYWRVYAKNNLIYYTGSPTWQFTTASPSPVYDLVIRNMSLQSINSQDDALEFDVCIKNTNALQQFEYAGGQYYLSFNSDVIGVNFADTNEAVYRIINSDLPAGLQPVNPAMIVAASPSSSVLSLSVNTFPGAGNGYIINNNFPGTRIVKMRILKKSGTFNIGYVNLAWRNPPVATFATKVFAYVDSVATDITTPLTHTIDSAGNGYLPVELSGFTANVNRNKISLNWTTERETNNSGFDVERKLFNSGSWIKAGNISGYGTTSERKSYSFSEILNTGKYNYRLKQIDFNGNYKYYFLSNEVEVGIPSVYSLSQNFPNPFNPSTKIYYDLTDDGNVSLILYDISGRQAATLVNEFKQAGYYSVQFNGSNLSSGIYFYRLNAGNKFITKKMMLIK